MLLHLHKWAIPHLFVRCLILGKMIESQQVSAPNFLCGVGWFWELGWNEDRCPSGSNVDNFNWAINSKLLGEPHKYYVKEKLMSEGKKEQLMIRLGEKTDKMTSAKGRQPFIITLRIQKESWANACLSDDLAKLALSSVSK